MRQIDCGHGCFALVDDEDFARLSQYRWRARLHNASRGPKAHRRPMRSEGGRSIYLHHDILTQRAGYFVDHINGNPLDNRRCNLRYATPGENVRNQRRARPGMHGYKGVCKKRLRFFAQVAVNGRAHWTRGFPTAEEAARAYDALALELHGEFASPNFPDAKHISRLSVSPECATEATACPAVASPFPMMRE